MTSGISATDGIGRRNSMVDAVAARSNGIAPMTTPTTMPATDRDGEAERPGAERVAQRRPRTSARPSWSPSAREDPAGRRRVLGRHHADAAARPRARAGEGGQAEQRREGRRRDRRPVRAAVAPVTVDAPSCPSGHGSSASGPASASAARRPPRGRRASRTEARLMSAGHFGQGQRRPDLGAAILVYVPMICAHLVGVRVGVRPATPSSPR